MAIVARVRRLQKMQDLATGRTAPTKPKTKIATVRTVIRPAVLTRWADDFVGFAALLDIIPKGGQRQKLRPQLIHATFEPTRTGRDIVLKPRQVGFTTWELARNIWFFLTRPGARVVVLVQSDTKHRPVQNVAASLRTMFEGLRSSGIHLDVQNDATDTWIFGDASLRILEAGGTAEAAQKVGRSGTIHRLHVTELAFFGHATNTLNAILECVPGPQFGSEVSIESTANGAAGEFYERFRSASEGVGGYAAHFYPWTMAPDYATALEPGEVITPQTARESELVAMYGATPEQVKFYRGKVADKKQELVDQEYPLDPTSCFLLSGTSFFDVAILNQLAKGVIAPLRVDEQGRLRIFQHPHPGVSYLIGADTSEGGAKGDESTAIVYRVDTGEHVATYRGRVIPEQFAEALARIGTLYNRATIAPERNNHGHAVLLALTKIQRYPHLYTHQDGKFGWLTNEVSRPLMLDKLDGSMRRGTWKTRDDHVINQMRTFNVNAKGKAEGAKGSHDDLVLAVAIGWAALTMGRTVRRAIADNIHA